MNAVDLLLLKWSDGTITDAEMQVLSESYDRASLDDFRSGVDGLVLEVRDTKEQWEAVQRKMVNHPSVKTGYGKWHIAAVVLLLVLAAVWYWGLRSPFTEVINNTQEPMHIAMSDGTEIELAPRSSISYDEDKYLGYRSVGLVGHAFFVVHQKGEFRVATNQGVVSVLGTSFDVWEQGTDLLVVSCHTGKVAVTTSSGSQLTISAGQTARCTANASEINDVDLDPTPQWMRGQLTFDDVPLADIYVQLEAFYDISFDGSPTSSKFSGALPTGDLSKVIEILNAVTEYTYTINGRQILVALPQ